MSTPPSDLRQLAVLSPPDTVPSVPPVVTRVQLLPFDALTWENFERLCHRMTALDGDVQHCARYGRQGDAQEGIDIFARQANGHYHCLQAKRHRSFGAAQLRNAVDLFIAGSWGARAARFTIVVQATLRSVAVQEEIELQTARLAEDGIAFSALDGESLTDRMRGHPMLVDDFFGRPWVAAVLGQDVADGLGARLDGAAFVRVRAQLARIYEAQFQFVDPGSFGSVGDQNGRPALTLLERFLKPDVLVRETARPLERTDTSGTAEERRSVSAISAPQTARPAAARSSDAVPSRRPRRLSLAEWLVDGHRLVLLGDAGCGKSTLLRVVALDLLQRQEHFPELTARWGNHIPVYIPFARWCSQVIRDGVPIGIKEIVRRSLEQLLTGSIVDLLDRAIDEQRVLLLVDGLDEWSSEQAARSTLGALVTIVEAHGIPAIVSGRPRGLSHIGTLPANWKRGTVAPLSAAQQATVAGRWFGRYAAVAPDDMGVSDASLRTNRFMAELARDTRLGALASVPLLLVGLVTLALRGQVLPRTRVDIYDQLVRVLLEVHPGSRATAAGDTESRFRHAANPDQRRAAIARLAFAVREQTGGGGMPLAAAQDILRTYFASPDGFDFEKSDAAAAASEILSVNAETQGLIVEKASGEVGFVHASFEEFLGAEHISGWPLSEIERFVRLHAGESRWRNVITSLLSRIQRRDEFDRLISTIEVPDTDELARFHRQVLLGDIAFGAAIRAVSTSTVKRLAIATMNRIETEDWSPARREALASVLRGLPDAVLRPDVERRLGRWLPARHAHRASLIRAFGAWQPTTGLQDVLFQAMHDEDRTVQRAAAAAYASAFSASTDACQRLLDALSTTRNLGASAAQLESLVLGWPNAPGAAPLFEEAWRSQSSELCVVGILGLAAIGVKSEQARDVVLQIQSFWSDVAYPYRDLAAAMLLKYWPGDETLIKGALKRASRNFDSIWEHDVATPFLLESPTDHPAVCTWVLAELASDFPFNVMGNNRIWSQVGRFAVANPEIRAAANAYWSKAENRLINMHEISSYVAWVADPPVAGMLVEVLRDKAEGFARHWALSALLAGWGRHHPEIKSAIDALADMTDEDLADLAALIHEIMPDKATARERLIRMGTRPDVRRDLLALGLEACGCNAADNEAVAAIFAVPAQLRGPFDGAHTLFRAFGAHPRVRSLAIQRIHEADAPFAEIAIGYADDAEFSPVLLDAAAPLPVDMRTQIVEVAAIGSAGAALEAVLSNAMIETDPELRARMAIAHYRDLPLEAYDGARQALLTKAAAVGSDYESVRAAALAGLVTMGALDALVALEYNGKPIILETGGFVGIASVERLICEHFAEFETAFGDSLSSRFKAFGSSNSRLPEILSVAAGASPAARAAFLAFAERGEIPRTPRALRMLASERPGSDLLLKRCWDALDRPNGGNDSAMLNGEIALILRDHFPNDASIRRQLIERLTASPSTAAAVPLAIFAPDAEQLSFPIELEALDHEAADWTVAVHVAAHRADSSAFCKLLEAMVTRQWHSQFDAQQITNLAVEQRLQQDSDLEGLLSARIVKDVNPSISGSFARYLAAAGKFSSEGRGRAIELLRALAGNQRLPVAGYDAIADQWRAVRVTLLDALYAGLELG